MQNVARHLDVVFWFKVYSSGLVFDNLKVQMNDMRQKSYWSFIRKHYLSIVDLPEVGVKGEVADCGGVTIRDREKDS